MGCNKELLQKAKETKSPEELLELAKAYDCEMTEESAALYYEMVHKETPMGELADEELDNVAGGCSTSDGTPITTVLNSCTGFKCKNCNYFLHGMKKDKCPRCNTSVYCKNCGYMSYEKGLWLCRMY